MIIRESDLDAWGIDIFEFMAAYPDYEEDDEGVYWTIDGTDADGDGYPDAIQQWISDPTTTRPSKGGAWTEDP